MSNTKVLVSLMTDQSLHELGCYLNKPGNVAAVSAGAVWAMVAKGESPESEAAATLAKGDARKMKPWAVWGDSGIYKNLLEPLYLNTSMSRHVKNIFAVPDLFSDCHLRFPVKHLEVPARFVSVKHVPSTNMSVEFFQSYVASASGQFPQNYKIQQMLRNEFTGAGVFYRLLLNTSFNPAGEQVARTLSTAVSYAARMGVEKLLWNWRDIFVPKAKRGSFPIIAIFPDRFFLLREDNAGIWKNLQQQLVSYGIEVSSVPA